MIFRLILMANFGTSSGAIFSYVFITCLLTCSRFCSEQSYKFYRDNIAMSDLNKVVICLEKIKSKNLGQNPDNMKHFSKKDFNYVMKKL